jgi:hypothetical protein
LKENYGESAAELLCVSNPRAALTGDSLDTLETEIVSAPRKWYQIWR